MIYLFITGFGKFNGISINPSSIIVNDIQANPSKYIRDQNITLLDTSVLEVSIGGVEEYFKRIQGDVDKLVMNEFSKGDRIIFLHFGVNGTGKHYDIEQRAINEASFRVKDEQNNKPKNQPIVDNHKDIPYQSMLYTSLNTKAIKQRMNSTLLESDHDDMSIVRSNWYNNILKTKEPEKSGYINDQQNISDEGFELYCEESNDAGRFLCNYIYFKSLFFTKKSEKYDGINIDSLFVHIPSQKTISIENQKIFVKVLVKEFSLF